MSKEYITHEQMNRYYTSILRDMTRLGYSPDIIVAPMRGGADMGVKFSHYFGVPVHAIDWQTRDGAETDVDKLQEILLTHRHSDILIVDDICDTGTTLKQMEEAIDLHCYQISFTGTVSTAVTLFKESSDIDVTFHGRSLYEDEQDTWFVFPWEEWWK